MPDRQKKREYHKRGKTNKYKSLKKQFDVKYKEEARKYLSEEVKTVDEAIQGAQDIIAERISDNPQYRSKILKDVFNQGLIVSSKKKKAEDEKQTFSMYYDYKEPIKRIANHRVLAMNRGEKEKAVLPSV